MFNASPRLTPLLSFFFWVPLLLVCCGGETASDPENEEETASLIVHVLLREDTLPRTAYCPGEVMNLADLSENVGVHGTFVTTLWPVPVNEAAGNTASTKALAFGVIAGTRVDQTRTSQVRNLPANRELWIAGSWTPYALPETGILGDLTFNIVGKHKIWSSTPCDDGVCGQATDPNQGVANVVLAPFEVRTVWVRLNRVLLLKAYSPTPENPCSIRS